MNYIKYFINKYISSKGIKFNNNNNILLPNITNKNIYKIFPRSNKFYIKPNNKTKELVIYGSNLSSSLNYKEYTKIISYMVNIPNRILYILVGLIISDGNIDYSSKKNLENSIFQLPKYKICPPVGRQHQGLDLMINNTTKQGIKNKLPYEIGLIDYSDNGLLTNHNCKFRFKQNIVNFEYI